MGVMQAYPVKYIRTHYFNNQTPTHNVKLVFKIM